jgi:hypothetical protein
MISSLLDAWPPRRRVALVVLLPFVATWFVSLGQDGRAESSPAWYVVAMLASVLGAAVLASYVPVVGLRLEVGCSPCAAMAFLTFVGASIAMRQYGADIAGPLLSSALLLFGLTQRMSQPATCTAPERSNPA